eukprot:140068-Chlamydomonas_euryale.AAC.5
MTLVVASARQQVAWLRPKKACVVGHEAILQQCNRRAYEQKLTHENSRIVRLHFQMRSRSACRSSRQQIPRPTAAPCRQRRQTRSASRRSRVAFTAVVFYQPTTVVTTKYVYYDLSRSDRRSSRHGLEPTLLARASGP